MKNQYLTALTFFFFLTGGLSAMSSASTLSIDLQECDSLYSKRGEFSLKAYECYQNRMTGIQDQDSKLLIHTRMLTALSATINELPKTTSERNAIDLGLTLLSSLKKTQGETPFYQYWRACFLSFDVMEKDRGAVIPTHTFRALGEIQERLRQAIQNDPEQHFYGPMRVMGIMHTQMPGIAGGDKKLAEKMLREAYTKAPVFSNNHVAYARILDINGKTDEAIRILEAFLALDVSKLEPYPSEPLLSLSPEILKDKQDARKLLSEIQE